MGYLKLGDFGRDFWLLFQDSYFALKFDLGIIYYNFLIIFAYPTNLQYRQLFPMFAFALSKQRTAMVRRREKEKEATYSRQ